MTTISGPDYLPGEMGTAHQNTGDGQHEKLTGTDTLVLIRNGTCQQEKGELS
jgi:hypothetical protein